MLSLTCTTLSYTAVPIILTISVALKVQTSPLPPSMPSVNSSPPSVFSHPPIRTAHRQPLWYSLASTSTPSPCPCPSHQAAFKSSSTVVLLRFLSHIARQDLQSWPLLRPASAIFTESGGFLRIGWTKTLQLKEGLLLIPLPSIPSSTLCSVFALLHFFTLVPASPLAPLFCHPTAHGHRPITFSTFSTCLKRLISTIDLNSAHYSPHTFCRSVVTFAFQSGIPQHLIKLHSDGHSDAFHAYLAPAEDLHPSRRHPGCRLIFQHDVI